MGARTLQCLAPAQHPALPCPGLRICTSHAEHAAPCCRVSLYKYDPASDDWLNVRGWVGKLARTFLADDYAALAAGLTASADGFTVDTKFVDYTGTSSYRGECGLCCCAGVVGDVWREGGAVCSAADPPAQPPPAPSAFVASAAAPSAVPTLMLSLLAHPPAAEVTSQNIDGSYSSTSSQDFTLYFVKTPPQCRASPMPTTCQMRCAPFLVRQHWK